jgi:hypothetical protein
MTTSSVAPARRKPNRNSLILGFDCLMALAVAATCNAHIWGLAVHEVLGLVIPVVVCVHVVVNRKWAVAMLRKLGPRPAATDGPASGQRKKGAAPSWDFWIDVALVVSFLGLVASGVVGSRVLFGWGGDPVWQSVHLSFAAASLALAGVHLGRHWNWVKGVAGKLRRRAAPVVFWLVLGVASLALVSFGGVWAPGFIAVIAVATVALRRAWQRRAA